MPDHIFGDINRNVTFAVWTPNVSPTISGVMVERRDQVRITCGLCEPARIRSTTFRMPLSTQAPFFNERGITHFRLPILDCQFLKRPTPLKNQIGNWQLAIDNDYLTLRSLTIIFFVRLFRRVL